MTQEQLRELEERGWRLTRDGSTATAPHVWVDPDDPDSGWELLVLHTAGHGAKFTLNTFESGLTERYLPDARRLAAALQDTLLLLDGWGGELPDEES